MYSAAGVGCYKCPCGEYSAKLGASTCTKCPGGKLANKRGQTSCDTCPAGTRKAAEGAGVCEPCYAGTISPEGSTSCEMPNQLLCCSWQQHLHYLPQRKYHTDALEDSASNANRGPSLTSTRKRAPCCSLCQAGFFSKAGAAQCSACPAGSYSTQKGSACVSCVRKALSVVQPPSVRRALEHFRWWREHCCKMSDWEESGRSARGKSKAIRLLPRPSQKCLR